MRLNPPASREMPVAEVGENEAGKNRMDTAAMAPEKAASMNKKPPTQGFPLRACGE